MHQLFKIPTNNREAQVDMINSLPSAVVPFVLSRGFGVTIPNSGKRALLMRMVTHTESQQSDATPSREDRIAVAAEIEEERQAQARLQHTMRVSASQNAINYARQAQTQVHLPFDIMVVLDECIQRFESFEYSPPEYEMVTVLPGHLLFNDTHTSMNPKTTMFGIVVKLLKTVYDLEAANIANLPAFIRIEVINSRMQDKFNDLTWITDTLKAAARHCNIYIAWAGICHMINMTKMYNYIRMLQPDQSRFKFTLNHVGFVHETVAVPPPPPPQPQPQMKALNIRIIVMLGLNEDDDDTDDDDDECNQSRIHDDDDHNKCGVCFDNFTKRKLTITGCNHAFCSDCIHGVARSRGLKSFIKCPSCRAEISELSVSKHEYAAVVAGISNV
jgi:hypothetical protein